MILQFQLFRLSNMIFRSRSRSVAVVNVVAEVVVAVVVFQRGIVLILVGDVQVVVAVAKAVGEVVVAAVVGVVFQRGIALILAGDIQAVGDVTAATAVAEVVVAVFVF